MRILLTEDEEGIIRFMVRGLTDAGYAVDVARDGTEGVKLAKINEYDLIIIDYMMPIQDGITSVKQIRDYGITTPVLMLTVIDTEDNIVNALDAGADDYMTKPFGFQEMLARARALMRRERNIKGTILTFDDLKLDAAQHKAWRGKKELDLSKKEFALLEYFLRNPEVVLTRNLILEHVWDYAADPFTNTVDVHIRYLRQKMDEPFPKKLLKTIHGIGYKLTEGKK